MNPTRLFRVKKVTIEERDTLVIEDVLLGARLGVQGPDLEGMKQMVSLCIRHRLAHEIIPHPPADHPDFAAWEEFRDRIADHVEVAVQSTEEIGLITI